ncbi:MAG TPA: molybdate ABC transporter substrate-binding protein, partial [Pedococcus sp.]|nr:molybdate ABC transporter substrate-binding protein [Pedococcus sp.]
GTVTVLAAASLTESFDRLKQDFEAANPGVTVETSYGSSATLVQQVDNGAPASVIALAGTAAAAPLDKSMVKDTKTFATNTLEIAVPPGNPAKIATFADLAKPGVKVVVCAPAVPCGAVAAKVEKNTGVTLKPVSEEQSVTDVLGKVTSGEADAGLVYVTDVKGAGDKVQGVPFPESSSAVNIYPIAALKSSTNAALAQEFVSAVTGADGQAILAAAGFARAP